MESLNYEVINLSVGKLSRLRTPKYAVEALDLKPNNAIECTVEAGKLVMQRIQCITRIYAR
jgi:antitoxin MazE